MWNSTFFLNNLFSHTIQQRHGLESHDLELYDGSQEEKLLLEWFCPKFNSYLLLGMFLYSVKLMQINERLYNTLNFCYVKSQINWLILIVLFCGKLFTSYFRCRFFFFCYYIFFSFVSTDVSPIIIHLLALSYIDYCTSIITQII